MSLSSLLVQRGVATIRDVEEALARQVLYGGDLVTNLLEATSVDERRMLEVLAESVGLRPAGDGALPSEERARALVPRDVVDKRSLLPMSLTEDGEQLVVAVAEPLSAADEEKLMFALGIPLVQRVAPLLRIREALARDYGLAMDRRFDRLARRLRGERVESMAPPPVKPKPTPREATPEPPKPLGRSTIASFPAPQGIEAIRAAAAISVPAATPSRTPDKTFIREGAPAPRPQRRRNRPITFEQAKRELEQIEDRDAMLDLLFDFSKQYFDYAALFVVHGDLAEGRDAFGSGASRDRVAAVGVPLDLPSMLSVAKERAVPVVTRPAADGIDGMFLADLVRPPKGEAIVVPLVVRRRAVALLYGDLNDSEASIENPSDVTTFSLLVGQAFERLIVRKKLGSSDRAMGRVIVTRETPDDLRAARAAALSALVSDVVAAENADAAATADPNLPPPPPDAAVVAVPILPVSASTGPSPVAASVPPPSEAPLPPAGHDTPSSRVGTDPPPANVLLVRRPAGPPIPREDPSDPTGRPPELVFPEKRPSTRPSAPPRRSGAPPRQSSPPPFQELPVDTIPADKPPAFTAPPVPVFEAPHPPAAHRDHSLEAPAASVPSADVASAAPAAAKGPDDGALAETRVAHVEQTPTPLLPRKSTAPPPRRSAPPLPPRSAPPKAPPGAAAPGTEGAAPARIDAEELSPTEAKRVLAEIEGEEIDDDMIEEAVPISSAPPSQTVVVAPHRPPTARGVTEALPTIIVDVAAELEVLVSDVIARRNDERAATELLRQGPFAMPAILAKFPGPIVSDLKGDEEFFPPFSACGPVLRLVGAQRKVALPYVLPLLPSSSEEVRFWATFALTELAYAEALPMLVPQLFDESMRVRKAARLAFGAVARQQGEVVARELGRFALDKDVDRRRRIEVVRLLQEIREPNAVPSFIALLDDADPEIAAAALVGLEVLSRQELGGDPKKWTAWWNGHSSRHRIEWLIEALMHDSLTIRKAASEELKAITKEYFGYYPDESKRDREKAQARYREWWASEGRIKFVVR